MMMMKGWHGHTLEDVAERELKDQKFYDDIFLKVKAFFGTDLAKMLGDNTAYLSADSIRDFIMAHLLPVDGDLIVKFLKFIRCSWDRTRDPWFDRLGDRILSHTPKAANGLDGLDIGADAETFRNNLQKLVIMIFEHNEALSSYFSEDQSCRQDGLCCFKSPTFSGRVPEGFQRQENCQGSEQGKRDENENGVQYGAHT